MSAIPSSSRTFSSWFFALTPGPVDAGKIQWTLCLFLAAYFSLQIGSYTQQAATYDESLHLASGYAALAHSDHRFDPTHPPLVRMWAALPLLAGEAIPVNTAAMDKLGPRGWLLASVDQARIFMFGKNQHHDPDTSLNHARFMIVALGAALGVMLFFWTLEWLGFFPAVCALFFYLIEPNLAAHASLVTTDAGLTVFYFGTIYFLWRTCREFTALNLGGLTLCFAFAIVTKYSALVLGPIVVGLLAMALGARTLRITVTQAGVTLATLALSTYALIWAVYGGHYAPGPNPHWLFRAHEVLRVENSLLNNFLQWMDHAHLLPNAYAQGLMLGFGSSNPMPGYLAGEVATQGWWYYFPLAVLIKTPLGLLVLTALGLVLLWRCRYQLGHVDVIFLLVPAAVYFGAAMMSPINIGLRHVLPVYPFMLLIAALGVRETFRLPWRFRWVLVATPALWWVVMFARVYPNPLTYFNLFAGGPSRGLEYLADSNQDWGQYPKQLKKWMDEHAVESVSLAYFGTSVPAYYGIKASYLPGNSLTLPLTPKPTLPGYVVIGKTVLSGAYIRAEWRTLFRGFVHLKPVADIANAANVYWVEEWPGVTSPAGQPMDEFEAKKLLRVADALMGRRKLALLAIPYYREYLKFRPTDNRAALMLAAALLETNQPRASLEVYDQVAARNPTDGHLFRQIASNLLNHDQEVAALRYANESRRLMPTSTRARVLQELAEAAVKNPDMFIPPESLEPEEPTRDPTRPEEHAPTFESSSKPVRK